MKPTRVTDPAYLTWIASLPCCVCGNTDGTVIYHHVEAGGMGSKCSDRLTVPLCHNHHTGDEGVHTLGKKTFAARFGIDLKAEAMRLAARYIDAGEKGWPI